METLERVARNSLFARGLPACGAVQRLSAGRYEVITIFVPRNLTYICVLLAGCKAQEVYVHGQVAILDRTTVGKITEGATAKEDLLILMGQPGSQTVADEKGDAWGYHYRCRVSLVSWRYLFSPRAHVWTALKGWTYALDLLVDETGTVQEVVYRHPFVDE